MLAKASRRAAAAPIPVCLYRADALRLPFVDEAFDNAVIGFALCTIPDPGLALREAHRVVKPGGTLRFLEHVRSPNQTMARWQDRLAPVWFKVAGGCRLNQETAAILEDSNWDLDTLWRSDGGSVIAGQALRT
jgi:ubiquinone/menaquinone biosynthesis C-methylase UbiE